MSDKTCGIPWEQFKQEIKKDPYIHHSMWRGQADPDWPLESSLDRHILKYVNGLDDEKLQHIKRNILRRFRLAIRGLRGPNPAQLSDNQYWALGRHYGMFTPLLDWSSSPYIAAGFAVLDKAIERCKVKDGDKDKKQQIKWFEKRSGADIKAEDDTFSMYQLVLCESCFKEIRHLDDDFKKYIQKRGFDMTGENQRLKVFDPKDKRASMESNNDFLAFLDINVEELRRMQGQRGYFTMLHSPKHRNLEGFMNSYQTQPTLKSPLPLKKFTISANLAEVLADLILHGIDYQLLYPDVEGAARQANLMFYVDSYHRFDELSAPHSETKRGI